MTHLLAVRRAPTHRTLAPALVVAALAVSLAGCATAGAPPPEPPPPALDGAALAARVKGEFLHAWRGYERDAWGHDELRPVSRTFRDWHDQTLYLTAVDALDTMLIMGLDEEAERTKAFLLDRLSFDMDVTVKNFEITIRLLGGLLSIHQMTGEPRFLALAEDLGTRLLPVFDTPTGMPYMFVNLKTGRTSGPERNPAESNPAEIGTLILEFGTLAKLTNRAVFYDKAKRALVQLYRRRDPNTGLVGQGIDVETGEWTNRRSHVGGAIDSYYEYLLKCEKLFDDRECGDMWRASIQALNTHLADRNPPGLWYGVADMRTGARTSTTFGALQAFFPAVLAMSGDVERARRLQESSFWMWTLHGIEPEVLDYASMRVVRAGYQLRPEIAESAYYLSHYTGDARYLEMGRTIFEDLVKYCRTDAGYTVLRSVETKEQGDLMHSFFLAETLKYLYLLFAPEALDFDAVVFNTEAHPLRRAW